jgi:hypothetical protein
LLIDEEVALASWLREETGVKARDIVECQKQSALMITMCDFA